MGVYLYLHPDWRSDHRQCAHRRSPVRGTRGSQPSAPSSSPLRSGLESVVDDLWTGTGVAGRSPRAYPRSEQPPVFRRRVRPEQAVETSPEPRASVWTTSGQVSRDAAGISSPNGSIDHVGATTLWVRLLREVWTLGRPRSTRTVLAGEFGDETTTTSSGFSTPTPRSRGVDGSGSKSAGGEREDSVARMASLGQVIRIT